MGANPPTKFEQKKKVEIKEEDVKIMKGG